MKKAILLFLMAFMLVHLNLMAQEESNYFQKKNEFNIQVDDIFAKNTPYLLNYYDEYDYLYPFNLVNIHGPKVGLGYKLHSSAGAFRVKINFGTSSGKYQDQDPNTSSDEFEDAYKYASHQEKLFFGYEFHTNLNRTQIFYGADAVFGMQISKTEDYRNYYYYDKNDYSVEHKQATLSYGLRAFLGFKYFISQNISISTEYYVLMEGSATKDSSKASNSSREIETRETAFHTKFGPLGQLTFSFHF